jgi:putative transcriptional regulator
MKTRIKEYRAKLNMTQAELAKKVGVRRETISFLEKGEYNPSLKLAMNIARQFKANIEDVFLFEESDFE